MFQFANLNALYLLIIVPFLVLLYIFIHVRRKKLIEKFGDYHLISKLMPLASKRRNLVKFIIYVFCLILLIFAIARPQYGIKLREVKTEGVEIIIALDISNSMLAIDNGTSENRLEMAKRAITRLLEKLQNDKIGLIIFAGSAYMKVPVTTDYTATKMILSSINPKLILEQGTAVGDAINLALKSFNPTNQNRKALIIITDGENHLDNPIELSAKASESGVNVYTIGIGDPNGSPIPVEGSTEFKKDRNGEVILTKLDEDMLIRMAESGNGKYIRANSSNFGLFSIYKDIEQLQKSELSQAKFEQYEEIYQYPVILVLVLLLFDFIIKNRKNKQLEKIKVFNLRG
jgi:Ca-activated chloride channel family protein